MRDLYNVYIHSLKLYDISSKYLTISLKSDEVSVVRNEEATKYLYFI